MHDDQGILAGHNVMPGFCICNVNKQASKEYNLKRTKQQPAVLNYPRNRPPGVDVTSPSIQQFKSV